MKASSLVTRIDCRPRWELRVLRRFARLDMGDEDGRVRGCVGGGGAAGAFVGPRMGAPERFGDHAREPPPSLLGIHIISLVTLNPQQELGRESPYVIPMSQMDTKLSEFISMISGCLEFDSEILSFPKQFSR